MCEENIIKIKLWKFFNKKRKAKELELESKIESLNNSEKQYEELKISYDTLYKAQTINPNIQQDLENELKIEDDLKHLIEEKKHMLNDSNSKEQEYDKMISDVNNNLLGLQKRIKEVKNDTKKLHEENTYDTSTKEETINHINEVIASIYLKKHIKANINEKIKDVKENDNRKKVAYKSRINSDMYDPNGWSCRCHIF